MFTKLRLERFKSFNDAELSLGPFTVIVGANATGKSNIRDAFRFLHGLSRHYSVAEILGEKWVEGGFLQWTGIRGGTREATYGGGVEFGLSISLDSSARREGSASHEYSVQVATPEGRSPFMAAEHFLEGSKLVFKTDVNPRIPSNAHTTPLDATLSWANDLGDIREVEGWASAHPIPGSIRYESNSTSYFDRQSQILVSSLQGIRFIDLHPEALRRPSLPGQTVLGDQGETLSSVLQAICSDTERKPAFIEWLRELTPLDVVDFEFPSDLQGKVLVTLVEANGRRTSAYSASDGTLRFLGMLAALLGPEPARFFFLEEIETGIHPTRLHLLIQLIEQVTAERGIQVVATTHSPLVLALLSEQSLEHASVTYRLEGQPDTRIRRLLDIPHAREVLAKSSAAHLHESGWFEDALSFTEDEQEHAA